MVESVPLARLKPAPWNPRLIRDERFRSLVRSLEADPDFMQLRPILATKDGTIYAGNMRYRAAAKAGWAEVPAIFDDVDELTAKARAVRDNNGWGEWQDEELAELLQGIGDAGVELGDLGFDEESLNRILGLAEPTGGLTDPDEIPEVGEDPYVKLGEVWELGVHRLMCGDSTDTQAMAYLMGDRVADVLWTDPPYGVEYEGKTKDKLRLSNDGWVGLKDLLGGAFAAADQHMKPGAPFYICHADKHQRLSMDAIRDVGWQIRQTLIWAKNTMVLGHSDYQYKHEPIFYGYKPVSSGRLGRGEGSSGWYGDHSQYSVFEIDKPSASRDHPTAKPVALVEAQLRNSSQSGDTVLDPFLGSGTTLIAAESLGRACYGLEIDPRYAQVVIERWQAFTGLTARRVAEAVAA
jgi:DNA modification methylase